jgi:hypothetical protein
MAFWYESSNWLGLKDDVRIFTGVDELGTDRDNYSTNDLSF